jgi:hypothetical protein
MPEFPYSLRGCSPLNVLTFKIHINSLNARSLCITVFGQGIAFQGERCHCHRFQDGDWAWFRFSPCSGARLTELHDVPPLNKTDEACMTEVAAVLTRHGKLGRFAQ